VWYGLWGNKMKIKKCANPYLHELFKSVLMYDTEECIKIVQKHLKTSILANPNIVRVQQEYKLTNTKKAKYGEDYRAKIGDVLWVFEKSRKVPIIHEIKTGMINLADIVDKYKGVSYYDSATNFNYWILGWGHLWVWCWEDILKENSFDYPEHENVVLREITHKTNKKQARLLPLEWLLPVVDSRLSDIVSCE
jgi:hypothetical protein